MSYFDNTFPDSSVAKNENWMSEYGVYKRDDSVYQRIKCVWEEGDVGDIDDENASPDLKGHEYHACINVKTGDIYIDCRRRKILFKHLVLIVARPIHTIIKTLWHATIIGPLIAGIVEGDKNLGIRMLHSIADIVRTPLYGLAMTITYIAGVILACVSPNILYRSRALGGYLERKLLRVNTRGELGENPWNLSLCFSPCKNIAKSLNNGNAIEGDAVEEKLTEFAKSVVGEDRRGGNPFNDCGRKLPLDQTYVSLAAK